MAPSIAVIHLIRKKNSLQALHNFINSYKTHAAGMDHHMIFALKGFCRKEKIEAIDQLLKDIPHQKIFFADYGFDIRVYAWCLKNLSYDYFCFFNSFSEIQSKNWLNFFHRAIEGQNIGLVGAAGCEITPLRTCEDKIKHAQGFFGWLIFWLFAQRNKLLKFNEPNYFIRTNAFMISKKVALRLKYPMTLIKHQCYWFESGRNSLSRQIQDMGLGLRVVDKLGNVYAPDSWHRSETFFWAKQENIMIKDNQIRRFEKMTPAQRRRKELLYWQAISEENQ